MGASTSHVETGTAATQLAAAHDQYMRHQRHLRNVGDTFVRMKLEECNCESVLQVFVDNEIDEAAFLLLSEEDLKSLLPTKLGPRKKIWALIQSLNSAEQTGNNSVSNPINEISNANNFDTTSQPLTVNSCTAHPGNGANISAATSAISSYLLEEEEPYEAMAARYMQTDRHQPELAMFSSEELSEGRSESSSNFFENAFENNYFRPAAEPLPPRLEFNRLSLNVQLVNQQQVLQTFPTVPDTNPFSREREVNEPTERKRHDIDKKVHRRPVERKPVERKPEELTPRKPNHKYARGAVVPTSINQTKTADGRKKHFQPKKLPFSFDKGKQLPIYKYKNDF